MIVNVKNVSFAYNGTPALKAIGLEIKSGEILALVGPNGSGKTTLLKMISGVLTPDDGAVYLDMQSLVELHPRQIAQRLAALEQEHHVGFDFTVREVVAWGRIPHRSRLSRWQDQDEQAVQKALAATGTTSFADRLIDSLSGGERQRIFIAMALAQQPKILLLDEPTAHLDLKYQVEILELVQRLSQRGLTVIIALHDLNLAARYADRIALIAQGKLVADGSPQTVLTESNIRSIWGIAVNIIRDGLGCVIVPK